MPEGVRRVKQPWGVVDWEEAMDGSLVVEEGWELAVDTGSRALILGEEEGEGESGDVADKETIFMPLLVLVLAGMNRVFWPFCAGIDRRWGWLALQHAVSSCVPVE